MTRRKTPMAETITIQLPENAHDREEVWQYLREKGLVPTVRSPRRDKYADLAHLYRDGNLLTGLSDELTKARKDFREDFLGNS
jgi:hypothetical protein